jgi:hypothetical protein
MPHHYDRWIFTLVLSTSLSITACLNRGSQPDSPGQEKPAAAQKPEDQPVNPDAKALAGFLDRVNQYVELHRKLEDALPHLSKESTPQQIDTHQRALGEHIQKARQAAKAGDIFTPDSQVAIKRLLARVLGGSDGNALKASIMDENPGVEHLRVNDRYPDTVPLSTIPPQVLEGLPKLPEEMEFRFIGNTLILMDVHAHIIADFIPNAFPR